MEPLEGHFFRHEYGRLVALLVRRVGSRHLEAIEDAVQSSLLAAVESWPRSAVPDNPSAWLYRVAHNQLAGTLRQKTRRGELAVEHARAAFDPSGDASLVPLSGDIRDDILRMLFVCCDDALPLASQLVLALKTLCGFDVGEIAERLFMTEANVYSACSAPELGSERCRCRPISRTHSSRLASQPCKPSSIRSSPKVICRPMLTG